MAKTNKSKYYVVWVGQNPGIYHNWKDCQAQISGYPNAKYKSFSTEAEAKKAFKDSALSHISSKKKSDTKPTKASVDFAKDINKNSISVDAACSGNPGVMEYRAVETISKEEIFRMGPFHGGTNNIGEFLALVHALAMLKQKNDTSTLIYTDSRTALSWLKNKKVKTTLKATRHNKDVFTLLQRAEKWVKENDINNKIVKWPTKEWGEIPADFGRK
jgi:ribonuclease HI